MKKTFLILTFAILSILAVDVSANAQGKSVEPKIQRDPTLEQDALKNLEIARHYFTTKKAYKAVLLRSEEIIAAHPEFSRMDEILYLVGMSSLYLSENKGKQKIDLSKLSDDDKKKYAPEKLREDAVANLNLLVERFPNSDFKDKAEKTLKEIDVKQASTN